MTKLIHRFPKPLVPLIVEAIDIERTRHQTILDNTISKETDDPLVSRFYNVAKEIKATIGDNAPLQELIDREIHSPVHTRQLKASTPPPKRAAPA